MRKDKRKEIRLTIVKKCTGKTSNQGLGLDEKSRFAVNFKEGWLLLYSRISNSCLFSFYRMNGEVPPVFIEGE